MALTLFRQGWSYLAGVEKPWYVPTGLAIDKVEAMGFKVLGVWDCATFPKLPVDTAGTTCGDDYNYVGLAQRTGPDGQVDLPDAVKWIVEFGGSENAAPLPQPQTAQPTMPGVTAATRSNTALVVAGSALGGVAVGVALMHWLR